ncbi:DegT/DnrJ/EryC1/StrS family aminotransferase, partial [bacterium]|nr:DegT/DnrJ/EryC1/StrS family aminotransferase [bacterium]
FQHFAEKTPGYETLYKGKVDYSAVECPVVNRICNEEAVWLSQETFLGDKSDMDDIAEAIKKIQQYADEAKD